MFKKLIAAALALYAAAAFAVVDVNKADAAALDTVKGIGPAMSARILEARKQGRFKDWKDLIARVEGIGEANAGKLSEGGLRVNGRTFAAAAAAAVRKEEAKDAKAAAKAGAAGDPTAPQAEPKPGKADAKKDEKKDEKKSGKQEPARS